MFQLSRRNLLGMTSLSVLGAIPATQAIASQTKIDWTESCDVLVAGGGVAGCMAALEAAKAGKNVILCQATPMLGGSSAISSGWIRSANTKWHQQKGIKDTAKAYEDDIIAYGNGTRDTEKAKVLAEESANFVNFLMDIGVQFTNEEDRANGGETLRVVKTQGGGAALMKVLSAKVLDTKGIRVDLRTKIVDVILDEKRDAVIGAVVEQKGKKKYIKTPAVILATGGFGRNQPLVEKFMNGWAKTGRIMDIEDKGQGLKIATDLGAGVANLDIGMVCPTLEVTKNIFYSSAPLLNGGIFVNENGRRFTNEYVIYTQTNIDMLKQKKVWEIVTEELHPVVQKMIKDGVATKCDTIEDMAKVIGCDPSGLKQDIEEHNAVTRKDEKGKKDKFGRVVFAKELKGPFYILQVTPVMIETVGGITINSDAQVTTLLGKPIAKGLYAAGALAFGEHFGRGYRSGDAYVYSGVTGLVAGRNAAK